MLNLINCKNDTKSSDKSQIDDQRLSFHNPSTPTPPPPPSSPVINKTTTPEVPERKCNKKQIIHQHKFNTVDLHQDNARCDDDDDNDYEDDTNPIDIKYKNARHQLTKIDHWNVKSFDNNTTSGGNLTGYIVENTGKCRATIRHDSTCDGKDDQIPGPSMEIRDDSEKRDHYRNDENEIIVNLNDGDNDDDDDDDDDVASNDFTSDDCTTCDSDLSNLSGLTEISGQEWKPILTKPLSIIQKHINSGINPRDLLQLLVSNGGQSSSGNTNGSCQTLPAVLSSMNDMSIWRLLANMLSEPPRRPKLPNINTLNDVVDLLNKSQKIIVLTGAGVSVSCGIPDFRSNDGIYSRLAKDFPDLPDPQAMFDINYFMNDPRPFYNFAKEIYPGQFKPSPCHRFIKLLETKNKLLRNYTQNIDTLEKVAGINNVIECHGSFATASCTKCKFKLQANDIKDDIFNQKIPICPICCGKMCFNQFKQIQSNSISTNSSNNYDFINDTIQKNNNQQIYDKNPTDINSINYRKLVQNGIMKPDIVFFGEGLPDVFHTSMGSDKDQCDLLIVIGSSLKVRPVALIPNSIPAHVPQILINRERLPHLEFDVELLGDSDIIINHLCRCLGGDWSEICWNETVLTETSNLMPKTHMAQCSGTSSSGNNSCRNQVTKIGTCEPVTHLDDNAVNDQRNMNRDRHFTTDDNNRGSPSGTSCDNDMLSMFEMDNETTDEIIRPKMKNIRYLSVDSTKDSGICDSSNSVPPLLNTTSNEYTNDDNEILQGCNSGYSSNSSIESNDNEKIISRMKLKRPPALLDNDNLNYSNYSTNSNHSSNKTSNNINSVCNNISKKSNVNHIENSIAERLLNKTYYHKSNTSTYIFPGAEYYIDDANANNDAMDECQTGCISSEIEKNAFFMDRYRPTDDENIDLLPIKRRRINSDS